MFGFERVLEELVEDVYRFALYGIITCVVVFTVTALVIYIAGLEPMMLTGIIEKVTSVGALVSYGIFVCIRIAYNRLIVLDIIIIIALIFAKAWADDYLDRAMYEKNED